MGKRDWSGTDFSHHSISNFNDPPCSTKACKRRSRRDSRTIPVPPPQSSRSISPSITVSLDRLLDALEFDPEWTPSAEIIEEFEEWEAEQDPGSQESDPECVVCCAHLQEMQQPVSPSTDEEEEEAKVEEEIAVERRKKIVLGPDGEPDIISDVESEEDYENTERIRANISPPVVLPKKELIYHINVLGEDGCLEIDRIDDKHPIPNCTIRDMNQDSFTRFYPHDYVQGVCSEILDPDIPAPRWLGEEFDKTEEELEAERRAQEKGLEFEYEF